VPISAAELYSGVASKTFEFKRLEICRGCRNDMTSEKCKECGRCRPETVQVPKYGMTPFGKQVVGMAEKEQESLERCREVAVTINGIKVPKGAKQGATLKNVGEIGHQTPGKLPGRIVLKVQHGAENDKYAIAENDLHTVLPISLEQALFGFKATWTHLGDQKVNVIRSKETQPNEVVRLAGKGLVGDGGVRGDLYIRLAIKIPSIVKSESSLKVEAPEAIAFEPELMKEDQVELREGAAWRRWTQREHAVAKTKNTKEPKSEL